MAHAKRSVRVSTIMSMAGVLPMRAPLRSAGSMYAPRDITSTPPPMPYSQSPSMMLCAVLTTACRPDEHRRFTAIATDSIGRPAWIEATRAT